ncbi:Integrase core domain protein [Bacillus subtilis]|nr:Integrase core domain protein [Bacillus subtilis]
MDVRYHVHPYRGRLVVFSKYYGFVHTKIVGWHTGTRMTKELVIQTLRRALDQKTIVVGIIHHSDGGSQYASHEYRKNLKKKNSK